MRWLKSLGLTVSGNDSSSARVGYRPRLEALESRQMLSVDPVAAVVGTNLEEEPPTVLPLAAVDQNIQDSWQAISTSSLSVSEDTGEKPQSKVWTNAGEWFAVLPNSSGTWIWRLEGTGWAPVLKLSNSSNVHADVKTTGNVAHVLLFDGSATQLASVQYVSATRGYEFWSARPALANLSLPGNSETATIDIDSVGRMWVCYENKSAKTVEVRYSDGNYDTWSGAITVASGINSDDIASIVAMAGGQIGVFWSNQSTSRFGFRTHNDNSDPNTWNAAEIPAAQSAKSKMADDHLHLAAASDGTVYVAAKTSYDSSGSPEIILMVRRPNGSWDTAYDVSGLGTRPIIVINEQINRLIVAYTERDGGGKIYYRESPLGTISLSAARVLIDGNHNNVSSSKGSFTNELLVIAGTGSKIDGTLLVGPTGGPTVPVNEAPLVSAGPDRATILGTPAALAGNATDDGEPAGSLSLQWSLVSGPGLAFFGNENQAATNVTFSVAGTYVLRLTANDGELTTSDDVTVTVAASAPTNQAPQVSAGSDRSGQTAAGIALSGTVTDDGNPSGTLTSQWSVVSGPGSVSFANANAASTTATFSAAGTYVLRLTGSDGSLSSSDELTVVVTAPPASSLNGYWNFKAGVGVSYASTLGSQGSLQGGATISSDGRLNLTGSNQRYEVPNAAELQFSSAITISAWIKPTTKTTQYVVKKAGEGATDGFELSLSNDGKIFVRFNERSFGNTYRVNSTSSYPTNGNTWMHVAATYDGTTIRLYVNGVQQGSKAASFTIGQNNLPLMLGSGSGGYRSMRGQLDEVLLDDRAFSANEISQIYQGTFSATPPTNQPPTASAGADAAANVGTAINLAGSVSDDGLPAGSLSSQWSVVSGPGSVTFGNAATPATTATFSAAGTYVLRLTASDGTLSALDEVTITASAPVVNQAPAGADNSISTAEDLAYTFSVADFGFSDPNDSPANTLLAVRIATIPASGTLTNNGIAVTVGQSISAADISGGKFRYTPATSATGPVSSSFTFRVQDNGGTTGGGVDLDPTANTITLNTTRSATMNFVRGLYQEILGRNADVGGLVSWNNQLRGGASTISIATGIWNSREHRGLQVDAYYQMFLHRAADAGGRSNWINLMLGGMTEEQVIDAFLTTTEYRQLNPVGSAYVTSVYRDLLDRAPTTAEQTDSTAKLNNGSTTPAQFAQSVRDSHERHLQVVDGFFDAYLRRNADSSSEAYWTGQLDDGLQTEADVAIALLSSTEFYNLLH